MKTLICTTPGTLEYSTKDAPVLKKDEAIIKIKRIGICGTDLHAFEGTQPFFQYPRILGHELSGELIAFDGAPGFMIGERVTILPYFNCGKCVACINGKPNCCVNLLVCGVHTDGGMVEYLSVPAASLVHGAGLSYDELALVEPLAIGAHGVDRAGVQKGEYVLIIGAGPIGLGALAFAREAGAIVIVLDVNKHRLNFCKDVLKADHILDANEPGVKAAISKLTNGDMPGVVIDATGNQKAINNAFNLLAHGGRYVLIGLQKGEIRFSHPEFHKREATLMSSRNATRRDFGHVISSIKSGFIKPADFITHQVKFDEVKNNFESWLDPQNGVIKAIVEAD